MITSATVFNVQRFTVHDGPGIRTEFFLKGCSLRCRWCSNPESYIKKPQVGVFTSKCIGADICNDCTTNCSVDNGLNFDSKTNKIISIDRDKCINCRQCYNACLSDALKLWGEKMSVEQAMEIIRKDKKYYSKNNGGVTLSGGEALLYPQFVYELFKQCKSEGIHTCLETALHVPTKSIELVMPVTDMVITDVKHIDSNIHKQYVGVGNQRILENIKLVSKYQKPLVIRTPIVPGFNDNSQTINAIGDFVKSLGDVVVQVQLLRFRPLGEEKYEALGLPYKMDVSRTRSDFEAEIKKYAADLQLKGIKAYAGATAEIQL